MTSINGSNPGKVNQTSNAHHIKQKKAYYILSNAKHPAILEIFNKGDAVIEVERTSLIGGKKAYRGKKEEYLFTNIPCAKEMIK